MTIDRPAMLSPEIVARINEYQRRFDCHPLTCINRGDGNHYNDGHDTGVLVATIYGIICPSCGRIQTDVPAIVLDPPPSLRERISSSQKRRIERTSLAAEFAELRGIRPKDDVDEFSSEDLSEEKSIHIIAGGTLAHIRPHTALIRDSNDHLDHALAAKALGSTGKFLYDCFRREGAKNVFLHNTKLAGGADTSLPSREGVAKAQTPRLETNADVGALIDDLIEDPKVGMIIMSAALVDFEIADIRQNGQSVGIGLQGVPRLDSSQSYSVELCPADKIINRIRRQRKDIFLVGFKSMAGVTSDELFEAGLKLLKKSSCNLVFANDLTNRTCMVITPEQAHYGVGVDREAALRTLGEMARSRSKGTFTRSTVIEGSTIDWNGPVIPDSLRKVVNHCIARGAYRPFLGATVGHFAYKLTDSLFVTSKRKTDFNQLDEVGMVLVESMGIDHVVAHGAKPSVGGMSQRIIFRAHAPLDCIVHMHCPLKPGSPIAVRSQKEHECGSHECGRNTSDGLVWAREGIKAVMLDRHGPNIVFHHSQNPDSVISLIEENWDLTRQTSELS